MIKPMRYKSLTQSFLYVECKAFPFVNVRMYALGNGRFDVYVLDGFGKVFEIKEGRNLDNAKKAFRKAVKNFIDVA